MPFATQHPLYAIWRGMHRRCHNPAFKQFADYGGRGIKVCERWLGPLGFQNFVADMGPRPDGYTIDRIDNDGHYEPSNCRWASRAEQQRNQRVTRRVTIEGKTYLAVDLAKLSGLKTDTITQRAEQGLPMSAVLSPERRVFTAGLALGGVANGRRQQAKTHCPQGHSYAEEAAYTPQGWRYCMECKRIKQSIRNHKKAEAGLK